MMVISKFLSIRGLIFFTKDVTITILLIIGVTQNICAQSNLESSLMGLQMTDYVFEKVDLVENSYGYEQLSLKNFKGKWIVLYFWTKSCTPCINNFPKLYEIQKRLGSSVYILLIGINDMYNPDTEPFFHGVRAAQKIRLPVAYDTVLVKQMNIQFASTVVIINPNGFVEEVMTGKELTYKRFRKVIRREN